MPLEAHASRDLLWRPAVPDLLDDRLPDPSKPHKLAKLAPTFTRHVMGSDAVIAVQVGHRRIHEHIALQLAEDRRPMPSEFLRNQINREAN